MYKVKTVSLVDANQPAVYFYTRKTYKEAFVTMKRLSQRIQEKGLDKEIAAQVEFAK